MIFCVPAAYALSRSDFFGKTVIDTLLDVPIILPPIALGTSLLIFLNTPLGASIQNNFIQFVFTPFGIVLAQFTVISSLILRLMKSSFDGINERYENVSRSLGYTKFQTFFKVVLPLSKNAILASTIIAWARAIGEFGATITLVGASRYTETLSIAIFLNLSNANIEGTVAVIYVLLLVSIVGLISIRKLGGMVYSH